MYVAQARADADKGLHVTHQLALWSRVLDLRIRTQRIFALANRLPKGDNPAVYRAFRKADPKIAEGLDEAKDACASLVYSMLDTRDAMLKQVGVETSSRKRPAETDADELWKSISAANEAYVERVFLTNLVLFLGVLGPFCVVF